MRATQLGKSWRRTACAQSSCPARIIMITVRDYRYPARCSTAAAACMRMSVQVGAMHAWPCSPCVRTGQTSQVHMCWANFPWPSRRNHMTCSFTALAMARTSQVEIPRTRGLMSRLNMYRCDRRRSHLQQAPEVRDAYDCISCTPKLSLQSAAAATEIMIMVTPDQQRTTIMHAQGRVGAWPGLTSPQACILNVLVHSGTTHVTAREAPLDRRTFAEMQLSTTSEYAAFWRICAAV